MKTALHATLLMAPLMLTATVARAQNPPTATQTTGATKSLTYVLNNIKKDTGASVLSSSVLATAQLKPPAGTVTAENLEDTLDAVVKSLPAGTIWAKLWLAPLPGGRQFKGDDLVSYAVAQSRLYPGVGASQPGMVEILGQKLPADKAASVVQVLGLKPVYILCNPSKVPDAMDFDSLSDDQKKNLVDKQVQKILSMPQEQQVQAFGQMFQQTGMVMGNLLKSMTPQQRQGFMQNIGQLMGTMMRDLNGPGGAGGPFGRPPRP
ncbi:MAG: hypothetical protein QM758_23435 [Armatimonas sp.]